MAIYDFRCLECNVVFEVERPMKEASEPAFCPECDGDLKRVYLPPQFNVPVYKATDVMNEYYSGERTMQGYTREKTMKLARGLYKQQTKNKGTKAFSGPTISTASNPVAVPYTPASSE